MNAKRLLKLADHLDTVRPKAFDMRVWKSDCGTTACALGHACDIPSFRRLGLKIEIETVIYSDGLVGHDQHFVMYGGNEGYDAADALFGITRSESWCLFSNQRKGEKTETPTMVAKRIRKFVATGEVPA